MLSEFEQQPYKEEPIMNTENREAIIKGLTRAYWLETRQDLPMSREF